MYNNPNMFGFNPGYMRVAPRVGLLSRLRGFNWGNLLTNTSKTLNVINQAIPIVYQVRPLFQNAKTMFKIADIIKSDDKKTTPPKTKSSFSQKNTSNAYSKPRETEQRADNQPTFFL